MVSQVVINLLVELAILEFLEGRLVLGLHQRLDRLIRGFGVVVELARREDHTLMEEMCEDMRVCSAGILGLYMEDQATIADVMVVPEDG